jgi:nitrate reductase gamma subunit
MTFSFMILGLLRHAILRCRDMVRVRARTPKRDIPWRIVARRSASWIVPVKHLMVSAPVLKAASFVFHIGLIAVPVLLADHVRLWARGVGIGWPSLGAGLADTLTILTIATGLVLLLFRAVDRTARDLSSFGDYALLVVLVMPFLSGWFASHPESSPLTYRTMMLVHVLSAELVFVLMPVTKLAHVVMFPFDRLSADVFWRLVPGAGARVAQTLRGSEKGVEA